MTRAKWEVHNKEKDTKISMRLQYIKQNKTQKIHRHSNTNSNQIHRYNQSKAIQKKTKPKMKLNNY